MNATKLLIAMAAALWAVAAAGVQGGFPLGPGDKIEISVYGQDDLATAARIEDDGSIRFPLLGPLTVGGLSASQAADLIAARLEQEGVLRSAHVNVLVAEHRSNTVAVLGAVNEPGKLVLSRSTTLTEALAMAGGITKDGSERIVLVRSDAKGRQSRQQYNLRQLLDSHAEGHEEVTLRGGDSVYVPRADQFYVYGEVQQPGVYPLDRPLNVMQALSISGGFNRRANKSRVTLHRQQSDGSVKEIKARLSDPIRDGDVLYVKESLF